MTEEIKKMLESEEMPNNIKELLDDVRGWIRKSRSDMSAHYKRWDANLDVFRGIRPQDADDREAANNDEPEKFVVPMTFTQVQTFVAFTFFLYTQNASFFSYTPTGDEDYDLQEVIELTIQRDLDRNTFPSKLYQFLLDLTRFNIGCIKSYWATETMWVEAERPTLVSLEGLFGTAVPGGKSWEERVKFEGNRIVNVSPYKLRPDTRVPLSEWQRGQFLADECEWHYSYVKLLERKGLAAGTKFISKMDANAFKEASYQRMDAVEKDVKDSSKGEDDFMCCMLEGQFNIIPKDYGLGDESFEIPYVIRMVNDQRIISIERAGFLHGEFPYDIGMFSPDTHTRVGDSLCDTIAALQDTVTWLVNSRIQHVRRSLENQLAVDPSVVDMASVEARSSVIMLKKGAPRTGIDKFIQQLKITDNTVRHFEDAQMLMEVMRIVTGVNENAMGQYSGGRRSATEARAANTGASMRMKLPATLVWHQAMAPLGRKLLMNQRQGMSLETFTKIVGERSPKVALYDIFAPQDKTTLVGSEDFFTFDGTLESEKGFLAQSLQELLVAVVSNPEINATGQFDVQKLIETIQYLRGVKNVTRFYRPIAPAGLLPGVGNPAAPAAPPGAQGVQDVPSLPGAPAGVSGVPRGGGRNGNSVGAGLY